YKHVERAFIQRVQRMLEIFATAYCIAIETAYSCLRKHGVQQLLQLFRSCPDKVHVLAAAMRAFVGDALDMTAIVAFHFVLALVVGHGDGTVLALQGL